MVSWGQVTDKRRFKNIMIVHWKPYKRRRRYLKEIFERRTATRNRYEKQETKDSGETSEKCSTADRSADSNVSAPK